MVLGLGSCQDSFLDLKPQDQNTDVVYFKNPTDFKDYTRSYYGQLLGWRSPYGDKSIIYNYMDFSSDLETSFRFTGDVGKGSISTVNADERWKKGYEFIRFVNTLFVRADTYPGNKEDIKQYVAESHFFRAYHYFNLLRFFGGIPIVKTPLDVDSPELKSPRNSRYEVVDFILEDLDKAIVGLPTEQSIAAADKGTISKWAAKAFKARVLLYEATWRKYNSTTTDFEGSGSPAKDQVNDFLTESIALSKEVMDDGGYELWNYNTNPKINNLSNLYLFNLEDEGSNPAGLTKASNNEFILYGVYDFTLRQGGVNLSRTMELVQPTRKLMDMFLCTDGLPAAKSPLFQGYKTVEDEYKNRDLRLISYINGGVNPTNGSVELGASASGYGNKKFVAFGYSSSGTTTSYRADNEESQNYPIIRLAEVYLNYAEAFYELKGTISNTELNASINKIRERAGVAALTTELATIYSLDIKEEIRRERILELFLEGFRYDDLKRWGIAEKELNASRCGRVVGGKDYPTEFRDADGKETALYKPGVFVYGEETVETADGPLACVVVSSKANHNFAKKHYLWPIPQEQINLSKGLLKQNPGY